jgi:hypothetical protein
MVTQQPKDQLHNKHKKKKERNQNTKQGNLYYSDNNNNLIGAITPTTIYIYIYMFNTINILIIKTANFKVRLKK